ncbi:MAG: dienelactone hydrolase [Moorea sp. SIO2B7]|nr:dienelactone hydrolase [Moorena sp. SIO2B7]
MFDSNQIYKPSSKDQKDWQDWWRSLPSRFWHWLKPLRRHRYWTIVLKRTSRNSKRKLSHWIQLLFVLSPIQFYRLFQTSMGKELLLQLRNLIKYVNQADDLLALQLHSSAKAKPVNSLGKFKSYVRLNLYWIHQTLERFQQLNEATKKVVEVIRQLAEKEAITSTVVDFSQLPDLRKRGNYEPCKQNLLLEDSKRDPAGIRSAVRTFQVSLYQPQPWPEGKIPIIVISHGLGSSPDDFKEYAEHLTSHGYFVAIPQHPGSDANQIQDMLAGNSNEIFKLQEFLDRPLDITYLLDELERRNSTQFGDRLNLNSVGVIGHSFGAYTALALAGAEINFDKLEKACGSKIEPINLSLLLQCRALHLPRHIYNFRDPRIKAVLPVDCVGSEVFGANGVEQIQIPLLMITGTEDRTAPAIIEQIRMFPWLKTSHRYLALMKGKAHLGTFSKMETRFKAILVQLLPNSQDSDMRIFCNYAYAISLAFFEVYLRDNQADLPYLQASYAQYISQDPFDFYLISAISAPAIAQMLAHYNFSQNAVN